MTEALPAIVESIDIDADIERVWHVMTSAETVPVWLGCLRYQRTVGATFYMQPDREKAAADDITGATHCEIVELEAPVLFKFSWFMPGTPETHVSFRLEAVRANTTRVLFEHEGWDKFPADQIKPIRDMLDGGWRSFVLPNLKRACEG